MAKILQTLKQIENLRMGRLLTIAKNPKGHLSISEPPPTHLAGMYWLLTNYSIEVIQHCTSNRDNGAVPISALAQMHSELPNILNASTDGFRIVYNGIAGKSLGVRGRIHQHFNGGKGTGCLSLLNSSLDDLTRWRISYVTLGEPAIDGSDLRIDYLENAEDLERTWRLLYGWPLLCRT